MVNSDKITSRQLFVLAFVSMLSPIVRILPRASVAVAGKASWLCVVPALIAGAVYLALVCGAVRGGAMGDGLADIALRAFGGVFGRVFLVLCAAWFTVYAGFVSRAAAERLLSSVYQSGSPPFFIAATSLAAVVVSFGTVKKLSRMAELFMPIIFAVVAFVVIFAAKDLRAKYLLPVTYADIGGILGGSVPIFEIFSVNAYFLFLAGGVTDRENVRRQSLRWTVWECVCALAVTVVSVGVFAPELALRFQSAFLVVIRNITIFGVAERIEAIIICVWIITDFTLVTSAALIAGEILRTVFSAGRRAPFAAAASVASGFIAEFMVADSFELQTWSNYFVPGINLIFTLLLIPAVLITARARKVL